MLDKEQNQTQDLNMWGIMRSESVRVEGMDEARTQMQEVKRVLLITTINKNYPVGEKQTGWTGQGRTGHKT